MAKVTRAQAEDVLQALYAQFPEATNRATLHDGEREEMEPGTWVIIWEGGYEEWDQEFAAEWNENNTKTFVEPRNSWSIGIYPGI